MRMTFCVRWHLFWMRLARRIHPHHFKSLRAKHKAGKMWELRLRLRRIRMEHIRLEKLKRMAGG